MAAAKQRQRRRRRAQDHYPVRYRRGTAEPAGGVVHGRFVEAGNDQRRQTAEGRHAGLPAAFGFGLQELLPVSGLQGPHDRVVGHVGLQQHPARPLGPSGPSGDLIEELVGPFRRPQVAAGQPQVRVNGADQGQHGEMVPLGDDLGADNQVDGMVLDTPHQGGGGLGPGHRVAGGDLPAQTGEQPFDLFGQALDPGAAGGEGVFFFAVGTAFRRGGVEAAMVALQPSPEPVFDQPCGAAGALHPMAAGPAKRQGRIAPAVQKQHRLFAVGEGPGQGVAEPGRQPTAGRRFFGPHVDDLDLGHGGPGVAVGQMQFPVAAGLDIGDGLQRRRRRGQDDGKIPQPGPDDGHVPGVVDDPVLLLERRVVFLVGDDQAQVRERQMKRRAGADHDPDFSFGDRPPGEAALGRRQVRMPFPRGGCKPRLEAFQPLRAEGDFRQQHQHLAALLQGLGDGLEIDLGLARPGNAIQHGDGEAAFQHRVLQALRRRRLIQRQVRSRLLPIRIGAGDAGRQLHRDDRARVGEPLDDAGAGAGLAGQFGCRAGRPFGQDLEHPFPGLGGPESRGLAGARASGRLVGARASGRDGVEDVGLLHFRRRQGVGHAHGHFQDRARGAQRIGGEPIDETPGYAGQGRAIEPADDVFQLGVGHMAIAGSPDDAHGLAAAKGDLDEIARRQR